jgi:hypothetical protein
MVGECVPGSLRQGIDSQAVHFSLEALELQVT